MSALAALLVSACAGGNAPYAGEAELRRLSAAGNPETAYRLNIGDKVKVVVFGEQELSGTFDVNASGNLAMPLSGEIPARGRTLGEVREAIARRLSQGYLRNPRLSLEIATYRPIYVHGEVRSGGEFAYKTGLRLGDAVAMAGGYSYRANESYVLLRREGEAGELRVALPSPITVMPGDNIRVPERMF